MPIDKKVANKVLSNLDRTASSLEELAKAGKVDARVATQLIREIDAFADRFQVAAYGEKQFRAFQAKVLEKDSDEKFMDTFDSPSKVLEKDADEPFMDTFDTDRTTTVTERDEHKIKDASDLSDGTKKQPSWSKGPVAASRPAKPKTWAK